MKLRQVKFLKSVKPYQLYAKMQPKLLIFLNFFIRQGKKQAHYGVFSILRSFNAKSEFLNFGKIPAFKYNYL